MSLQTQNELVGRRFLGLIVLAGLVFSALSGLILSDGFGIIQSNESVIYQNLCENGFLKSNPNFLASLSGSELFDRIEIFESTLCFVIFSCFFRS